MANPANVAAIESRWRPLTSAEAIVAATRLDDAWRILKRLVPTLENRLQGNDDLTGETIQVLADSVIRLLRNPDGIRRRTIAVDDASSTADYGDTGTVSSGIYFTDAEIDALAGPAARRRARAFSVMPS